MTPRPVVLRAARSSTDRHRSHPRRSSTGPGYDHRAGSFWLGALRNFSPPGPGVFETFWGPFRAGLRAARPRCTPSLGRAGWHELRFRARPSSSERAARAPLHLYDASGAFFYFGTPFWAKIPPRRLCLPDPGPDGPESLFPPRSRGHGPGPPSLPSQGGGGGRSFRKTLSPSGSEAFARSRRPCSGRPADGDKFFKV